MSALTGLSGCLSTDNAREEKQSHSDATAELPPLAVDGNHLVTPDGTAVTLRGVSIVDPKRGSTTPNRGRSSEDVLAHLTDQTAGWYPTVIRIPVQPIDIGDTEHGVAPTPPAFTQAELETYLSSYLDPLVAQCAARNVYAIIDFHRDEEEIPWGSLREESINQSLQAEATVFWETVASRYADADHVLYEVYNEPTTPGMWGPTSDPAINDIWALFLTFMQPIVDTIRNHSDAVAIVGSPGWSTSPEGALLDPVTGGNIAYAYHVYPGHAVSKNRAWDGQTAGGGGVEAVYETHPLFVTEFGWRDYDDRWLGGTTADFGEPFMNWLESHDAISWTAWCADVWWEPAMFVQGAEPDEWLLRGADSGSDEDAGQFIKEQLAAAAADN
jgi:hypothetical protein